MTSTAFVDSILESTPDDKLCPKHNREKRKLGRPVEVPDGEKIAVLYPKSVIEVLERIAKQKGVTRSEVFRLAAADLAARSDLAST